jgi:hypothetical protein
VEKQELEADAITVETNLECVCGEAFVHSQLAVVEAFKETRGPVFPS